LSVSAMAALRLTSEILTFWQQQMATSTER
jgi:hypothetical protein